MADTTEPVPSRSGVPYRTILTAIWLTIASAGFAYLVVTLHKVFFQIVVGAFLALVLNPAVTRLQRWRLSRGKSIAIVVFAGVIGVTGIGALIAAPLATQAVDFATNAGNYLEQARTCQPGTTADCGPLYRAARRLHLENKLANSVPAVKKKLSELSTQIVAFGKKLASAAFSALIIMILAIFMLVEGPNLIGSFMAGVPPGYRDGLRRIGSTTSRVVAGYTTGVLLMALGNGLVAGIALAATGSKFVLPLATWAAVVDILPIVGGLFSIIPAALFAFIHSTAAGIIVILAIFAYQQVKNHALYPIIVGRAVQLNSLLVLVAVLIGAELGHVSGAVLAIPIAGGLQAVLVEASRLRAAQRGTAFTQASPPEVHKGRVRKLWERYRTPKS